MRFRTTTVNIPAGAGWRSLSLSLLPEVEDRDNDEDNLQGDEYPITNTDAVAKQAQPSDDIELVLQLPPLEQDAAADEEQTENTKDLPEDHTGGLDGAA